MPVEVRDNHSGAKLFIPTPHERATRQKERQLDQSLKEVEELKEELKNIIKQHKV